MSETTLKQFHNIESRLRSIADALWAVEGQIGMILFDQTTLPKIIPALGKIIDDLHANTGQYVNDYVNDANEASNSMFRALLAGAAMNDPENVETYAALAGVGLEDDRERA